MNVDKVTSLVLFLTLIWSLQKEFKKSASLL
jgi:hypothetical protein